MFKVYVKENTSRAFTVYDTRTHYECDKLNTKSLHEVIEFLIYEDGTWKWNKAENYMPVME